MIIDAHTHLGDILDPGGGSLIEKGAVGKERVFDPVSIAELQLHSDPFGLNKALYTALGRWVTRAERARNLTATRENMRRSMDEAGVQFSVCLPIPPHVGFADLKSAMEKDSGIIPFTGVDFTKGNDVGSALSDDVKAGAKGLKLHPIIQMVSLDDQRSLGAVEAFSLHGLPVLFHCGLSSYYPAAESARERPEFGGIAYAERLVKAFPGVKFIAGHAGLFEVDDVIDLLGGFKNVSVDVSFQSPAAIRRLVGALGPERVLYGSDWPWGSRMTAIKAVKKACRGDRGLERRIFYENASDLLLLSR
jgi:predicted TIM-barrel fold metal-dependent hydrolase